MKYYLMVENNEIIGKSQSETGGDILDVEVSEELYNDYEYEKYIYQNGEIISNPNWDTIVTQRRRQELDQLTLTPADVERALYKAKGMDFEDLKSYIATAIPTIDLKGLAIEFRAKDFYRGATLADGTRLIDIVGALLNYTPDDMDYLFLNKELPVQEEE